MRQRAACNQRRCFKCGRNRQEFAHRLRVVLPIPKQCKVLVEAILIAGIGTGITLAFKPFFTVPAALCIVAAAIHSRSWRVLFSPENGLAALLVFAFSFGTYVFYPEYFTITYPLVRDVYLSPSMPASVSCLR